MCSQGEIFISDMNPGKILGGFRDLLGVLQDKVLHLIWGCIKCIHFGLKLFIFPKQFHSLAPMYYRGSAAAVIVYDITKQVSMSPLEFRCHLW